MSLKFAMTAKKVLFVSILSISAFGKSAGTNTTCEQHVIEAEATNAAQQANAIPNYVQPPTCLADGSFAPQQCNWRSHHCWCVNVTTGLEIVTSGGVTVDTVRTPLVNGTYTHDYTHGKMDCGRYSIGPLQAGVNNTCTPLHSPLSGDVSCSNGSHVTSVCQYTCHYGYWLTGNTSSITCGPTLRWSDYEPYCSPNPQCFPMMAPPNGEVVCSDGNAQGSNCSFTCNSGHRLCGNDRVWCHNHFAPDRVQRTQWSGYAPICLRDFCSNSSWNNCSANATCAEDGVGYICSCDAGFVGNGFECKAHIVLSGWSVEQNKDVLQITPFITEQWANNADYVRIYLIELTRHPSLIKTSSTSEEVDSPKFSPIIFSNIESNVTYTVEMKFGSGGALFADAVLEVTGRAVNITTTNTSLAVPASTTLTSSSTSGAQPSCPFLDPPSGGDVTCSDDYRENSICNITCQTGYTMCGGHQRICETRTGSGGTTRLYWSGDSPLCIRKTLCQQRYDRTALEVEAEYTTKGLTTTFDSGLPDCLPDGRFAPRQCSSFLGTCWCVYQTPGGSGLSGISDQILKLFSGTRYYNYNCTEAEIDVAPSITTTASTTTTSTSPGTATTGTTTATTTTTTTTTTSTSTISTGVNSTGSGDEEIELQQEGTATKSATTKQTMIPFAIFFLLANF